MCTNEREKQAKILNKEKNIRLIPKRRKRKERKEKEEKRKPGLISNRMEADILEHYIIIRFHACMVTVLVFWRRGRLC